MPEREFKLPDLGEGLTEGEVVRWLVAAGDAITLNQPIVEVETAKAVVEIPAPYAGTVVKLHAGEGDSLDVGAPLISVDTGGGSGGLEASPPETQGAATEAAPEAEQELQATLVGPGERQQVRRRRVGHGRGSGPAVDNREHAQSGSLQAAPAQRPRATPPVRRYAKDRGVDRRRWSAPAGTAASPARTSTAPSGTPSPSPPRPGHRATGPPSGSRSAAPAARSRPP